jgi:hypothetical protein
MSRQSASLVCLAGLFQLSTAVQLRILLRDVTERRSVFGILTFRYNTAVQSSRTAFLKLWSADHKWSSGSALVVLGLTFYEINYPAYIDVLL